MYFKNGLLFFLLASLSFPTTAQTTEWSLEKCIQYALENSLNVQQSDLAIQQAALDKSGNEFARLPNLNASGNYGYQFGRTIDPTSNSFVNRSIGSNTWSLNTSVTLYNGGRINKSIEQSEYDLAAAKSDLRQMQNDIALSVANAYLNVLFAEEQRANARTRLALTQAQLEQTDRLVQAGQIPENDRYDILATIAQNEQAIVTQQNNVALAYLNLKQLLQLDPATDLRIQRPDLDIPSPDDLDALALETVFEQAIRSQPFIQADALRLKSAETGVALARTGMYPRLSVFGGIDTRFSTESFQQTGTNTILVPQTIFFNSMPQTVEFETEVPVFEDAPYFDQLSDNLGQTVGLSLSIPIYNNHTNKINVERAELNIANTQINNERNRQQLKTDIQTAIANAKAAYKQLQAAQKTRDALRIAYENATKRLRLGATNAFQVTSSKNSLDTAEVDYIVAKYDYIFKRKIVDFYLGKPIRLE